MGRRAGNGWEDLTEVPVVGRGWTRKTKQRSAPAASSSRVADHQWIAPCGKKFKSEKKAREHALLEEGAACSN